MKTRAAVATGPDTDLDIREIDVDDPRPDELRVKMVASGICHTDAICRDQWYPVPLPAVLGHEGAGIVEAVGRDVQGFAEGDHVVLGPTSCGTCLSCASGHPMYCGSFFERNFGGHRADGSTAFNDAGSRVSSHFFGQSSFAEYTNAPANGAVRVDARAPLDILGPLGCGIMTGSGTVLNVLRPEAGTSLAIFGTGAVGLAAMLAAKASGVLPVIMVDVVASRLDLARKLGATHVVDASKVDAVEAVRDITGGGAQYAVETTGIPKVFAQMTKSLAARGHGAVVGAAKLETDAPLDIGSLLPIGIRISFVVEGDSVPRVFIPRLIALHQAGLFPFDTLIKHYKFDQINQAFADSAAGLTIKPVVTY